MRLTDWLTGNPLRKADPEIVLGKVAGAIDRSPLGSVVVVAAFIAVAGMGVPMVAGQPQSCSERVVAKAKIAAKSGASPELAERLAGVGYVCHAGDSEKADQLLAGLDEETRLAGY